MRSLMDGPPRDVAPGVTGTDLLLATSDSVSLVLGPLFVWPEGVRVALWISSRPPLAIPDPVENPLVFGVEFADGRRASIAGSSAKEHHEGGPGLWNLGGIGGQGQFLWEHWLLGLPPEGPLKLICAWPQHGIAETITELDSEPIREAAARATPLWPST